VHDVWSSLVPRFDDSELGVSLAALHVLASLADVAGSFLRSRVADNVVPALRRALLAYAARSPVQVHSSQHKRTLLALDVSQCDHAALRAATAHAHQHRRVGARHCAAVRLVRRA
jgi:hypothetical protein